MPGGFLDTARPLSEGDWKGGITFTPQCGDVAVWACGKAGTKDTPQKGDPQRFDPFLIYSGASCSGAPVTDDLREIVRGNLERGTTVGFARQLVITDDDVDNIDITTAATDITPDTPTGLRNSLGALLSALDECGGGEAVIHAPIVALPHLLDIGVVERGGRYFIGNVPVSIDHYPPLGGVATDPSNIWLYLTRPVEYATTAIGEIEFNAYRGRLNDSVLVGERLSILRFDPCCVYAILSQVCP